MANPTVAPTVSEIDSAPVVPVARMYVPVVGPAQVLRMSDGTYRVRRHGKIVFQSAAYDPAMARACVVNKTKKVAHFVIRISPSGERYRVPETKRDPSGRPYTVTFGPH